MDVTITWTEIMIIFGVFAFITFLPGILILVCSYVRYPPMWWRVWRSKRIKGPYMWRVYK